MSQDFILFPAPKAYKKEIVFTLHDINDDKHVQAGLSACLIEEVSTKPEFATMAAHAFRTVYGDVE